MGGNLKSRKINRYSMIQSAIGITGGINIGSHPDQRFEVYQSPICGRIVKLIIPSKITDFFKVECYILSLGNH